jgi:hypothetical protein
MRGGEKKSLAGAPNVDPTQEALRIADKHRDAGWRIDLARKLVVFGSGGIEQVEHAAADPVGQDRIAGGR